jgi:polyprenyl-phospho-N-acetylgalactosaminyl synthase
VVVPAFNESAVIGPSVRELRNQFRNVVVVDDGSIDATSAAALGAGAVVLRHSVNAGQGAALQTGIDYALARGAKFIATFDADGQHQVKDLLAMLAVLQRSTHDIVLGSRFLGHAEGLPMARRLVLKAAVVFTNWTTGVRLTDAHNGLRVMTAPAARQLHIRQDGMAHASELIEQIGRLRLRYEEVPVTITYSDYSKAKGQRLTNSLLILRDLVAGWLLR